MSVLWALTAGTRFGDDDLTLSKLLELMQRRARSFDMSGGILSQFPWIRFVAPEASGYTLLNTVNSQMNAFFMVPEFKIFKSSQLGIKHSWKI
jgi:hypothetical protein